MCGRYQFYERDNTYINRLLEEAKKIFSKESFSSLALEEVYPSQNALVAIYDKQKKNTFYAIMKWGYSFKDKLIINTRKESIDSNFYQAFKHCIIPASAYYEWSKSKQKYKFYLKNEAIFLAGLYLNNTFTIITEEATNAQKEIHHRQPVILTYQDAKEWCMNNDNNILDNSIQNRLNNPINL